jgi:hypothetical protein
VYQGESVGVSVLAGIQQPLKCPHPLLPPLMCPLITCPQRNYPNEGQKGGIGELLNCHYSCLFAWGSRVSCSVSPSEGFPFCWGRSECVSGDLVHGLTR